MNRLFRRTAFETGCTVAVEHSDAFLNAYVELDGDIAINPGDEVRVHGAAIAVPFGERIVERRVATVTRAGAFERAWVRLRSWLEITEMYEVSFSSGRPV